MRGLTPRPRRDEKGAVIVMMTAFVLGMVGMAALVVDVGAILDEKRQLQNGADAAALGLARYMAKECPAVLAAPCTASQLQTKADELAVQNARDSSTKVEAPTANHATKEVTVKTSTLGGGTDPILPYAFGQVLTGVRGQTVKATATASWAGLSSAPVIPLTLSKCEFTTVTQDSTVFDVPTIILFHTKAAPCGGGPDLPGGFGWLKDDNDSNPDDCTVTPTVGDTIKDDTGVVGTPHSCNISTLLGKNVLFALYDSFTGGGGNGKYHIYGFGEFHITGYYFSNSNKGGVVPCAPPNTCVGGYFIRFVPIGDLGGPNLGDRVALVS